MKEMTIEDEGRGGYSFPLSRHPSAAGRGVVRPPPDPPPLPAAEDAARHIRVPSEKAPRRPVGPTVPSGRPAPLYSADNRVINGGARETNGGTYETPMPNRRHNLPGGPVTGGTPKKPLCGSRVIIIMTSEPIKALNRRNFKVLYNW